MLSGAKLSTPLCRAQNFNGKLARREGQTMTFVKPSLITPLPSGFEFKNEINLNLNEYFSGEVNSSKLENGVTVISKHGNGVDTTFGVFINSGRKVENSETAGVTSFFPKLAFKSTVNTSGLRVSRYVESITGEFNVKVGRETVEYHANFLRPQYQNVATSLAEILRPRLAEWEIRDAKTELEYDVEHQEASLEQRIVDAIYFQAYRGQGVGRLTSVTNFDNVEPINVANFVSQYFVGNNVTVVGVGIDHESMLSAAEAFSYLPAAEATQVSSKYFGGEYFEEDSNLGFTSLTYAFPYSPELDVEFRVLSNLLGSNLKKNRTKIGSGSNSRLNLLVNEKENILSAKSYVLSASNGGGSHPFFVVTVNSTCGTTAANEITSLLQELSNVSEAELKRGINLAKLQYNSELENRNAVKNLLHFGRGKNPTSTVSLFDNVSSNSLQNAIRSTLNKPTVVRIGAY